MVELARTYPMPTHVMVLRYALHLLMRTAVVSAALCGVLLVFALAVEEGAFDVEYEVASGLDAFARMFIGVAGLGGGFGAALLGAVVHDIYRRRQRRVLDRFAAESGGLRNQIPVEWQRLAVDGGSAGTVVLSGFAVVLGPVGAITAMVMVFSGDDVGFALGVLAVCAAMTWAGVAGFRSIARDKGGAAHQLWNDKLPPLHPLEPPRSYDSDGNLRKPGMRTLANTARAKSKLAAAPAGVQRLDHWDRIAARVMTVALAVFAGAALVTAGITVLRKPCQDCEPRYFDSGVETFIDGALALASVLTVAGLAILVVATAVEGWIALKLRRTVLDLASVPDSQGPPWFMLRRLLLEETPLQSVTGHLHTVAVSCLAVGLSGLLVGETYPFGDWAWLYPVLNTVGGILLLFHVSGWFWQRDRTLRENEALRERWSD